MAGLLILIEFFGANIRRLFSPFPLLLAVALLGHSEKKIGRMDNSFRGNCGSVYMCFKNHRYKANLVDYDFVFFI